MKLYAALIISLIVFSAIGLAVLAIVFEQRYGGPTHYIPATNLP